MLSSDFECESASSPDQAPPRRPPPPFSDRSIDEWHQKINEDFNSIYQSLRERGPVSPATPSSHPHHAPTQKREAGSERDPSSDYNSRDSSLRRIDGPSRERAVEIRGEKRAAKERHKEVTFASRPLPSPPSDYEPTVPARRQDEIDKFIAEIEAKGFFEADVNGGRGRDAGCANGSIREPRTCLV